MLVLEMGDSIRRGGCICLRGMLSVDETLPYIETTCSGLAPAL